MTKETFQIRETYCNRTEGYTISESSLPIKDSIINNLKELYQYGLKNLGRCTSKVYIDKKDGSVSHVGYTFEKKHQYTDTKEFYIQETWLTIDHYKETTTREYFEVK